MLRNRLQLIRFSFPELITLIVFMNVLSMFAFSQCEEPGECIPLAGFEIGDGTSDGSNTGNPTLMSIELPLNRASVLNGFDLGDGSDDGSSGNPEEENPVPLVNSTKGSDHYHGTHHGLFDTNSLATADALWVAGLVKLPRLIDPSLALQTTRDANMFVARYERGTQIWGGVIPFTGFMQVGPMSSDDNGNLALTGNFSGTLHLGNRVLKSRDYFDGFVVCLDVYGQVLWLHQVMGQGTVVFEKVAFNSEGLLEILVRSPFPQGLPGDDLQKAAFTFDQFGDLH